ncbi:ADP-ribosylation factor [Entamoeba marina]
MGNNLNWISQKNVEKKLLMFGLDGVGKNTIQMKLSNDSENNRIPTIAYYSDCFNYKDMKLSIWIISRESTFIHICKSYYDQFCGIILVIDSSNKEMINEVKGAISILFEDESLKRLPLLVFANKQDLFNAMKTCDIIKELNLHLVRNRKWYCQNCCAINGEGLCEGLDWLLETIEC